MGVGGSSDSVRRGITGSWVEGLPGKENNSKVDCCGGGVGKRESEGAGSGVRIGDRRGGQSWSKVVRNSDGEVE